LTVMIGERPWSETPTAKALLSRYNRSNEKVTQPWKS